MGIQRLETHTAGGADGLVDRPGRHQRERPGLQPARQVLRRLGHQVGQLSGTELLTQQRGLHAVQAGMFLQVVGQAAGAPPLGQRRGQLRFTAARQQVDLHRDAAVTGDRVAQAGRRRIHQAALDARGGDDELARAVEGRPLAIVDVQPHRLHRCAGKALGQVGAPAHVEAAVGRLQGRHRHAAAGQVRHPGSVAAQPRPAGAAQGQHHGIGPVHLRAGRRVEAQQWRDIARLPALPAVAHVQPQAGGAQPVQPGTQQGRRLHLGRKHPAGAAHEGGDAQADGPVAQRLGRQPV